MSRDGRLDSIKGVLIVLVVLGHLIGQCGSGMINYGMHTFIYTFHMPLFIIVSGYFTKLDGDKREFWKGILKIAVPLSIFQLINAILLIFTGNQVGLSILVVPYWTLWYLLSLIFWRIILRYSPKMLIISPFVFLCIAFVISCFCGLMPYGRLLSFQRTLNFFPFFLYGYYMKKYDVISKPWNKYASFGFIALIIVLIACKLYPDNCDMLLRGADQYRISDIPSKVYMLICAYVVSMSFYSIIKENKILAMIGKGSLMYYLYHGIFIMFVVKPLVQHFGLPTIFPFMLLYCLLIVAVIYFMGKTKIFRWLVNPLEKK